MKPYLLKNFTALHTSKDYNLSGFTLVELIITILIISILSAIALPSLLSQASKAKQAEAKTYIGAINRAQQYYRASNSKFAVAIEPLGLGIPTTTANYDYSIKDQGENQSLQTIANAAQVDDALKSYSGSVVIYGIGATTSKVCETDSPAEPPVEPTVNTSATTANLAITCAPGSSPLQ